MDENLINLSFDSDEVLKECESREKVLLPLIASPEGRVSLENNPFDLVQKLSICPQDDPFEVVEKEASLKARQSFLNNASEVKLANLLSLSGDNEFYDPDSGQSGAFSSSTIYHSANANDLENESPPITVSTKWTPESSNAESGGTGFSCDSSDSSTKQVNVIRNRKVRQLRNRLLKISISNSSYNTPMSSRNIIDEEIQQNEDMLAAESPLKSMYDDIMTEQPPETIYTEKDFDADLELMQIPMLNQIESPGKDRYEKNEFKEQSHFLGGELASKSPTNNISEKEVSTVGELPDIESIRLKLRAKRLEASNNNDIQDIIKNLKTLICESTAVNEHKKQEVNCLLETLSSTLSSATHNKQDSIPKPITRQGTFNCDLNENNEQDTNDVVVNLNDNETDIDNCVNFNNLQTQVPMEDIPDIMIKSSATYDGESTEDKEYLNLPQIDPLSPTTDQSVHPNLNGIMEQIQHLLEQQFNAPNAPESTNLTNVNSSSAVGNNPTFIVVMPTISHDDNIDVNQNSQICGAMRRRSQSLSIHDKLKIVQLPVKPSPGINSIETYESPPFSATNTTPMDADCSDFKTPARFLPRRNSFSSATPYTPTRFSRFHNSTLDKERINGSESSSRFASPARRLSIMDTHNETQCTQPQIRPNIDLLKPDPKKKVKTTASIGKQSGPLKATLPVKKIAPNVKSNLRSSSFNTSIHMVTKGGIMSNTSTPASSVRTNGLKVIGKAIPAADSTPTIYAPSPNKLSAHSARYSNLSTTPIGKALATPTVSSGGLRRRTISEFKAKSPMKPRLDGTVSGLNNGLCLSKTSRTRSNLIRPSMNLKTCMNTRSSTNNTSTYPANRNKENKHP